MPSVWRSTLNRAVATRPYMPPTGRSSCRVRTRLGDLPSPVPKIRSLQPASDDGPLIRNVTIRERADPPIWALCRRSSPAIDWAHNGIYVRRHIANAQLGRSYVGLAAFTALTWGFTVWRGWLVST